MIKDRLKKKKTGGGKKERKRTRAKVRLRARQNGRLLTEASLARRKRLNENGIKERKAEVRANLGGKHKIRTR